MIECRVKNPNKLNNDYSLLLFELNPTPSAFMFKDSSAPESHRGKPIQQEFRHAHARSQSTR